jgi:hypothetical protein
MKGCISEIVGARSPRPTGGETYWAGRPRPYMEPINRTAK